MGGHFPAARDSGTVDIHDVWYVINSSRGDRKDPEGDFRKVPFRDIPASSSAGESADWRLHKLTDFRKVTELVLLAVGVLSCDRAREVSARHGIGKSANFLFADARALNIHRSNWPKTYDEANNNTGYPKFCLQP